MKSLLFKWMLIVSVSICWCCGKSDTNIFIDNNPCAKGKLLFPQCSSVPIDYVVIQVLDTAIGVDLYKGPTKNYKNCVTAHLSSLLRTNTNIWDKTIASADSVFYFKFQNNTYPDFPICEAGIIPKKNIRITSFYQDACPSKGK